MAHLVLTSCRWYVNQYDLSGEANQHILAVTQEVVEHTTFGSGGVREYLPGLKTATHTHAAFTNDNPLALYPTMPSAVVSLTPETDVEGGAAMLYQSRQTVYTPLQGTVGDAAMFQVSGQPTGPLVTLGRVLLPKASRTSSSNSTGVQVGAISATQTGYGALHVFSGTASTLAVKIQSDTSGFPSPTDRITFATASGATSEWKTVAGAVTDDWWRVVWTLGGGTWSFAVTFGITAT